MVSGFFQVRNALGTISLPQEALIINRNTFDYNFNSAMNPVVHIGNASLTFNTGMQFTVRRDTRRPGQHEPEPVPPVRVRLEQFVRQLAVVPRQHCITRPGRSPNRTCSSNDVGSTIEFTVGRPWGKTALITGYTRRDLTFSPLVRQFFTTSTYAGIQRKFGQKLTVSVLGEYIRSWRVQDALHGHGAGPASGRNHSVQVEHIVERGRTVRLRPRRRLLQDYDNMYSSFFISYVRPFRRTVSDSAGRFPVEYPLRFSFGVQAEQFPSSPERAKSGTLVRPVVRLTIF